MSAAIVCVLRVEDTREWVSGPAGAHPIPGSGRTNRCARCGLDHEVHAHVLLSDGSEAVMGVTCARRENAAIGVALQTAEKLDRTIRASTARLQRLKERNRQLVGVADSYRREYCEATGAPWFSDVFVDPHRKVVTQRVAALWGCEPHEVFYEGHLIDRETRRLKKAATARDKAENEARRARRG